jgi:hypothetical protein
MTDRRTALTDERLARFLRARSTAADATLLDDIVRSAETTAQERPGLMPRLLVGRRRLSPNGSLAVAVGVFVLVVAVVVGAGLIARSNVGDSQSTPAASPSPASWTGPVRADVATLPVVAMVEWPELDAHAVPDSRDSREPWADVVDIQWRYEPFGDGVQSFVRLVLAARPPRAETLRADEIISYGLVIDTNADGVADYEIGIATDAHDFGPFRAWVTDLATGFTEEENVDYGEDLFDFRHPDEVSPQMAAGGPPEVTRTMAFTLTSSPPGFDTSSRIYAWSLVTRGGEVVAWDYAPDAAWARLPGE